MKIQRTSTPRASRAGEARARPADGERFRQLLEDQLPGATADARDAGDEARRERPDADVALAHALHVLDDVLARIEQSDGPDAHALDEQALEALQSLRGELARCAPEPLRQDADAMLAVESERLKRPW